MIVNPDVVDVYCLSEQEKRKHPDKRKKTTTY